MRVYTLRTVVLSFIIVSSQNGCLQSSAPVDDPETELIYSATFEIPADTQGWWGCGEIKLYSDISPTRGQHCLMVSGDTTCLLPAHRLLDTLDEDSEIIFQFQAKSEYPYNGSLHLVAYETDSYPYPVWHYNLPDTGWRTYADTIQLWKGADLRIHVYGLRVFLDNLKVLKIRSHSTAF